VVFFFSRPAFGADFLVSCDSRDCPFFLLSSEDSRSCEYFSFASPISCSSFPFRCRLRHLSPKRRFPPALGQYFVLRPFLLYVCFPSFVVQVLQFPRRLALAPVLGDFLRSSLGFFFFYPISFSVYVFCCPFFCVPFSMRSFSLSDFVFFWITISFFFFVLGIFLTHASG